MIWLFNPFVIPLLAAAAVCMGLLFIAGRYRQTPGSVYFILLMLSMAGWTAMYGLELGAVNVEGKRLWALAQYLAIPYVPVFWLAFLLAYTGRSNWLTGPRLAAGLVVPLITSVLALTNADHHLILRSTWIATEGSFNILVRSFGGWFWVHTVYCYVLLAAGCLLIGTSLNRTPQWYWGQRGLLLFSCLIPWLGNAFYITGTGFLGSQVDPTPFLFTLSVLLLGWAVFYGRLFDIIPIGHDAVVKSLPDGVIILDRRDRVVEINPAACRLVGEAAHVILGRPARIVLGPCLHLVDRGRETEEILENMELETDDGRGFFHIRITPIRRHGRLVARLFVLQDITDRKYAQDDRLDSEKLKAALEMAGAVCHKLNQPIQGIYGYAELLMLKMAPDDPLYGKIAAIRTQTEKMGEITNKLMGITRYRTARYTSGETIVDIDRSSSNPT
jgi:PAS domain S-box-containing protein